jgi:hypothetical protein
MGSIFSGVDDARPSERTPWFPPGGVFLVQAVAYKGGVTNEDDIPYAVGEFDVLKSNLAEVKIGEKRGWFSKFKKQTPALGNFRKHVAIANQCELAEVDTAACEMVIGDDQPLKGTLFYLRTSSTNKKDGDPFTVHEWSLAEDVPPEEVLRLRRAAGLPDKP